MGGGRGAAAEGVHERADSAGEDAHRRQEQIERNVARRERNDGESHASTLSLPNQHVAEPRARRSGIEHRPHVGSAVHLDRRPAGPVGDDLQSVAHFDSGLVPRPAFFHPHGDHPAEFVAPENAVVHNPGNHLTGDIRRSQRKQQRGGGYCEGGAGDAAEERHAVSSPWIKWGEHRER